MFNKINDNRSKMLFEESKKYIPGGVNSPVRAFKAVNRTPLFIDKAKGSHIFDVDGNEFVDYVCSWGPGILGHANERVIDAVKRACDGGLSFGAPTEIEYKVAKLVNELMPSMELTRMVNSGTEAVMSALRVARGYTNRPYIVKFRGCYHGHSDGMLIKSGSGALTGSIPDSLGVPKDYAKYTLLADYNDEASVKALFEELGDEIAGIIVEPVAANMGVVPPKEGFLQFLRDITNEYGALLIFDEVITGFRLGLGGAQEYYNVKPDLTTLGKIIGGGMPVGAYGGRRDIMEMVAPLGAVYQAGTLSGNPIAMTAGLETLTILANNPSIYDDLEKKAEYLETELKKLIGDKYVANRVGSLMCMFFTDKPVTNLETAVSSDTSKYAEYFSHMLENNIYIAPAQFEAMFVSVEHSKEDLDKTISAWKSYFA